MSALHTLLAADLVSAHVLSGHLVAAHLGDAVLGVGGPGETVLAAPVASVDELLNNLRNWLVGILAALATVFLTIGGVRYMMATDPGDVEKAKGSFRSAAVGYALAVLAPLAVTILKQIVGG